MKDHQSCEFTCKTCGGLQLTVTRRWNTLAETGTESWQEWGPLEANHLWHFEFKEMVEPVKDDEAERGAFGDFAEDDSDSEPQEYETPDAEGKLESEEFYVNCAGCDREVEFGWSEPERGGRIFPAECSDFIPGETWPEPRYVDSWQQKHWLPTEAEPLPAENR